MQEVEEDTERQSSVAVEKALSQNPKLLKLQGKLDKCIEEKRFLDEVGKFDNIISTYLVPILNLDDIFQKQQI